MAQTSPRKLWTPSNPEASVLWDFSRKAERWTGKTFHDYESLYEWSTSSVSEFWKFTFDYFPIVYTGTVPARVVDEGARMDSVPKWFDGVRLNFAENILYTGDRFGRPKTSPGKEDSKIACTAVREGCYVEPIRHVSWKELRRNVGRLSSAMRRRGVRKGDRIAVVSSVSVETLLVFLAAASIGAIFSSSSTDMGTKGILDRLLQIKPKYVFMDDASVYKRKTIDLRTKMAAIVDGLRNVPEFHGLVSQKRFDESIDISKVPRCETWDTFMQASVSDVPKFEQLAFSDPLVIVYSSGTTGQPKCIVHTVGGVVLSGHKESTLHRAVTSASTQLQFTTTGWMMYVSAVQLLLMGARTVLYDGNPFEPDLTTFIRMASEQKVTHLGISPRFMQTLKMNDVVPKAIANLECLQMVTSTGMVLSESLFEWFYDVAFPPQVQLANISGGTDIMAAFGTCNPLLPVYAGGSQCIALGMAVSTFDPAAGDEASITGQPGIGRRVPRGEPGELVCTRAFPTMPHSFYGQAGTQQYFNSYFARYDNIWYHGDLIMFHRDTKHVIFLGRADGVLNPSGIRFGSAEIYNVIDDFFSDDIADSICVGQRRQQDDDERVMLFLLMKPGRTFSERLARNIRALIRKELSPRHVPTFIFPTPEIPMTVNGKKVENPVKQIVSGKTVKPSGTLINPDSLAYYYDFAKDERLLMPVSARL